MSAAEPSAFVRELHACAEVGRLKREQICLAMSRERAQLLPELVKQAKEQIKESARHDQSGVKYGKVSLLVPSVLLDYLAHAEIEAFKDAVAEQVAALGVRVKRQAIREPNVGYLELDAHWE